MGKTAETKIIHLFSGNCLTLVLLITGFRRKIFYSLILALHFEDYCYLHISVFVHLLIYTWGKVLVPLVFLNPNCLTFHILIKRLCMIFFPWKFQLRLDGSSKAGVYFDLTNTSKFSEVFLKRFKILNGCA